MSQPKFQPSTPELHYRPSHRDGQSDEEIKELILSDRPVTSAKNVWAFWDSGWDGMKPWRQRNIIDWARRLDSSWEIRLIDTIPRSPRHFLKFLSPEVLPAALVENRLDEEARNSAEHASDMVRLPLLYKYGGVYMDVGECISFEHYIEHGSELRDSLEAEAQLPSKLPISAIRPAVTDLVSSGFFLLQDLDDICWDAINDPNDPHEFCAAFLQINSGLPMFANGFLACLPGNQFVKHWNSVFLELWKDRTSCVGLRNHPLLDGLPRMDLPDEFKVGLGTTMSPDSINDYVAHIITMTRLISIVDPESGFSGPKYFNTRCRLFRLPSLYPMHEVFLGKEGFSEQRQFEIFQLPRLTNSIEPEQVAAKRFIEGTLTGGILKKLSHGTSTVGCAASYLDEVVDADVRPGTWGEYFRWATVHLVYPHIPEPVIPGGLELARIEQAKVMGIIEEVDFEIAKVIRVD